MASVLLTKVGGGGDQTELLTGTRRVTPDEATSAFLALEEASEAESGTGGVGGGRGRRGKTAPGAACACRLTGERAAWLLLGLLLLGALAAAAAALHLLRGREIEALRRDVDELKRSRGRETLDELRKDLEQLKTAGLGASAAHELQELKHKVMELDLYTKLRQFEDEVYEMEEEDSPDDEDDEEDEDDLSEDGEDDVDYYPDSEEVPASAERGSTPGPEHRGRFHPQYERLLGTHAPPHAPPHVPANAPPHVHASRKKPGSEPAGAALAAAEAAAAEAAEATTATSGGDRPKREIPSGFSAGLPKEHESYKGGVARRVVNGSEGLSLYPSLVNGGDPFSSSPVPPALPSKMLRSGESKRTGKENRDTQAAATRRHLESGGAYSNQRAPSPPAIATPTPNVISRQSHVMQTATPAAPNPRRFTASRGAPAHAPSRLQFAEGRTSQVAPPAQSIVKVHQDQRGGATLRSGHVGTFRYKKKPLLKKTLREGEEAVEGTRSQHALRRRPVFAAHYGGDSSINKVTHGREHYGVNGRLRHPNKLFTHWRASDWVNKLDMERKFSLHEGHVSITDSGLYFVYAQIYYLNENYENGYLVEVNGKPFLQCTVTPGHDASRDSRTSNPKANTCYTAGALYLAPGDKVSVREVGDLRWTVFQPEKSFFGLVKLGHSSRIT